jgi:RHS repeat-associated protein
LTRAAAILLTLWISLLAGISSTTVHHGQEGVDPASYPLAAYGYDANGNLAGVSYANQVTHAYAYNTLNRLTGLAVDRQPGGSGAIATPLHGYGYTLNLAGQRTHIAELGGRTIAHTYDALHRLTSEAIGHAQGNAAPTPLGSITYDYDENNNRLARNTQPQNTVAGTNLATFLPNQNHFYNERDQLAGHDYDANGNTTSSLQSSVFGSSVSDVYSFDNRLIRRERADGITIDLLYSTDGDRVAKWTEQGGVMRSIHRYLVDRLNPTGYAQVLEEKDHAGQLVARHLYGHDLIASDIRNLQSSIINRQWYAYDGLGSVRSLTDDTGVVQETYDYDAYGTLIGFAKRNGAGDLEIQNPNNLELITNNRYLFTGEQWDADLGMYFLRARYLNPGTGRFHTEDTYEGRNGEPLTLHKYLYAHANPVMNTDPSGNVTLSEVSATIKSILSFTSKVFSVYQTVSKTIQSVQTVVEVYQMTAGGGLTQMLSGWKTITSQWGHIPTGSDTARLFTDQFWDEALSAFKSSSAFIFSGVLKHWSTTISRRLALSDVKKFSWIIYMPTPGDSGVDKLIPNPFMLLKTPLKIAGAPVEFEFGHGGNRGRVLGAGIRVGKNGQSSQMFRLDYHNPHKSTGSTGDADFRIIDKGPFHVHIRNP